MENSTIANLGLSLAPVPQNLRTIDWGPNGMLAAASESFVNIYQFKDNKFSLLRTISGHKSNIICVKFSCSSVELIQPYFFQLYLAVGDEFGNCIVYDVFAGSRHAGLLPTSNLPITILDIQWRNDNPSVFFVMTSIPSLMAVACGHVALRRASSVGTWADRGLPFQSFNMTLLSHIHLNQAYSFMTIDPFHPMHIILASQNNTYCSVQTQNEISQSQIMSFSGIPKDQKIIAVEFYPHAQNRLVLMLTNSIILFDIGTHLYSVIIADCQPICPANTVFSSAITDKFWLPFIDGKVSRLRLTENNWIVNGQVPSSINHQNHYIAIDKYCPHRMAILSKSGRITIHEDRKGKLFTVAMAPNFPGKLAAWNCNEGRFVFVTNQSYLGLLDQAGHILRLQIEDNNLKSIYFAGENRLVVGGQYLHIYNIKDRIDFVKNKNITPNNLVTCGTIIAYNPFPNILDVVFPDGPKQMLVFSENILCFAPRMADSTQIAVMLNRFGGCIVDISEPKPKQSRFSYVDESAVALVYVGRKVFIARTTGDITMIDLETDTVTNKLISSVSLTKIRCMESYLLVGDESNNWMMMDLNLGIVKNPKMKILDARFLTSQFAITQNSPTSIRILQIPLFESFSIVQTRSNALLQRFLHASSTSEFESIALEAGDLEFVQFVRTFQGKGEKPLATAYSLSREEFIAKESMTRKIEKARNKDALVEFLILTGKNDEAATLLMESDDDNSMLLAYACMTPHKESAMKIVQKTRKFTQLAPRLLCIVDEPVYAVNYLMESGEWSTALKYLKIACSEEEAKPVMVSWILMKPENVARNAHLMASIHDHHASLSLLENFGLISKAYAYLQYLENNNIPITESPMEDVVDLVPIQELKDTIKNQWEAQIKKHTEAQQQPQ